LTTGFFSFEGLFPMKQAAIACVVLLLCAAVAGANGINIPVTVTTGSQNDALSLGFSETLTTNVGTLPDGSFVDEIDIRLTSIGGTYSNGADAIPSTTGLVGYGGTFYIEGGVAYLYSSRSSGSSPVNPNNGASGLFGNSDYPGYWSAGHAAMTTIAFPSPSPSPSFGAAGSSYGDGSYIFEATQFTAANYTNNPAYYLTTTPAYVQGTSTYDNQLLAAIYVSPGTTGVQFYTDDGNPWNVNNSTGGYGQMGFSYSGGRTDYVEIQPTSEPAALVMAGSSGLVGLWVFARKRRRPSAR
jgi:hypothetical protein